MSEQKEMTRGSDKWKWHMDI